MYFLAEGRNYDRKMYLISPNSWKLRFYDRQQVDVADPIKVLADCVIFCVCLLSLAVLLNIVIFYDVFFGSFTFHYPYNDLSPSTEHIRPSLFVKCPQKVKW